MTSDVEITAVREAHRFDEAALARYLAANLDGFDGGLEVGQFEGGQSNPTFHLKDNGRRYVLRKKPPGDLLPSAHQVDREYRVMTALAETGVPVPRTHILCQDDSVIGTAFYVMEMVEGRVLIDPLLPSFSADERRALYDHFIEVLAKLHGVDYEAVGLGDFGRAGNYYTRQIGRWTKQYVASQTEDIPEMEALMEWLPANIPVLHNGDVVGGAVERIGFGARAVLSNLAIGAGELQLKDDRAVLELSLLDRATGLRARLSDGNALGPIRIVWRPDGQAAMPATAEASIIRDFDLVATAVRAMARGTEANESDALSAKPFRRASLMPALFEQLGIAPADWCCLADAHLPAAREDLE